jgi:hypothetical protein
LHVRRALDGDQRPDIHKVVPYLFRRTSDDPLDFVMLLPFVEFTASPLIESKSSFL